MQGLHHELHTEVIATIAGAVPMDAGLISPDSTFEALGIDSLDVVNIVFAIEERFGIRVPEEFRLASVTNVDGLARVIDGLLAETEPCHVG